MTTPAQPAKDDTLIQAVTGLADTPLGQRLAVTITVLLGQDNARQLAAHIGKTADGMSGSGLIVAGPGTNGRTDGVA